MDNVEQQLLSIWQEIIHSAVINPQDNLLDQGGNSLHFIKLASMVS
ncbi:phosphopantetheine-binding protein, partial [Klebsiella michiganensis]